MRSSLSFICTALVLTLGTVSLAQAQQPLNSEIKITKIEPLFVESPKISGPAYTKRAASGRAAQWIELDVTFDRVLASKTSPKFADELTFTYYILLNNQLTTEDKKPTMLTGSVTHVTVHAGKDLHSSIYVSPRTILRMFDGKSPTSAAQAIFNVGVTVSGKDGFLAAFALKGGAVAKDGKYWWDNTALYTPVSGFLLNKGETPFAPLEWDYFEAIKPKSSN